MGEFITISKEKCRQCKYCGEAGFYGQTCDYYLIKGIGHRRGGTATTCDKFEEGKRPKNKNLYGKTISKRRMDEYGFVKRIDSSIDEEVSDEE